MRLLHRFQLMHKTVGVFLAWSFLTGQDADSVDFTILSGGAGNTSGTIGDMSGTISFTIGQPIITTSVMSGTGQRVELGYWNRFKRRPEGIDLSADYEIRSNEINLRWSYDPNSPKPASGGDGYTILRGEDVLTETYDYGNYEYEDTDDLTAGTEYTYTVKGSNQYGLESPGGTALGKTSTQGRITGHISTPLGTNIPGVRVKVTPNWGNSIYLDGDNDHGSFRDDNIFELGDNSVQDSLTLELWFKTPDVDGDQTLLAKGDQWKLALKEVSSANKLAFSRDGTELMVSDENIDTDEWVHAAIVKKKNSSDDTVLEFYVNGSKIDFNTNETSLDFTSLTGNSDSLFVGKDSEGNFFRGNMDEIRIWTEARDTELGSDSTLIKRDYDRYLFYRSEGDTLHPTLGFYANMDVGTGDAITNSVDQDLSGDLKGESDESYWSTTKAPAYAVGFTDEDGLYEILNINYGTSTTFTVSAGKPFHEFDPVNTVTLDQYNTHGTVNFSVNNLQSITGYVQFDSTRTKDKPCGERGVKIFKNGEFATITDEDGYYRVEVEPGADAVIEPQMDGRDTTHFSPKRVSFTNVVEPQSQDFTDLFTRELRGTVGGGTCQLPLGPAGFATVILTSATECFSDTAVLDAGGNYRFTHLPIMQYEMKVEVNIQQEYDPEIPEMLEMNTHFSNSGFSHNMANSYSVADTAWSTEKDTVDFTYFSNLSAEFTEGFSTNIKNDYQFEQNEHDTIGIHVFEPYYNGGACDLTEGSVKIRDYIGDVYTGGDSDTLVMALDSTGRVRYPILPGEPNTSPGGSYPYQKKFEIVASDPDEARMVSIDEWAVVLGHKPVSVDFTTTAPSTPFLILRRPPGDGSIASFTQESQHQISIGFSAGVSAGLSQETAIKMGFDNTLILGGGLAGPGTKIETETELTYSNTISIISELTSSYEMSMTWETSETFTTSTADDGTQVGPKGDVFVGGALNILYGTTDVLELTTNQNGDFIYNVDRQILFIPNGFATTFQYSRRYIEVFLIPELEELALYDSTKQDDVDRWNEILAYEDSLRSVATFEENRSFDGTAGSYTATKSYSSSSTLSFEQKIEIDTETAVSAGLTFQGGGAEATSKVSFGFSVGSSQSIGTTNTTTTSFTLEDNDPSDDFSVDIHTDPVYGTPVFWLVAGNVSCPYEEWINPEGEIVSTPADAPYMEWLTPSTATNVLTDGVAEFKVLLRNESSSQQERTYYLSIVSAFNPNGAIIAINGEDDMIDYTLDYLEVDSATVTVERPPESDVYEFENLRIKFAPECETTYAGVTEGYTLPFTANFARPCSEISIYEPNDDFVVNLETDDTLYVTITDYDLNQSYFDEIEMQYSPVAEESWYTIPEATVIVDSLRNNNDQQVKTVIWPTGNLNDGQYSLRMKSVCLEGALVNLMPSISGVIDTEIPVILGDPEPVDDVLNSNDEIAANFTETIDPVTVRPINITLEDPAGIGEITDLEITSNENRIVIDPQIQNRFIENRILTATITGYRDMYGNPGDDVSWDFLVNRNPIGWNVPTIDRIAFQGESNVITTQLNNIGATAQHFDLTGLPEWLEAFPVMGDINPGGSFEITLTIDPFLNVGEYADTIIAETPEGNEPLVLNVISMCQYPLWPFDFTQFEYSMNVTAALQIKGTASEDIYDRVGAFVDGEPRGIADVEYVEELDTYLAFLDVYSSLAEAEQVEFRIWDRTGCREYWQVDTSIVFEVDGSAGTPSEPLTLNANGAIAQQISVHDGFTWLSLNLDADDMSVSAVMGDLNAADGDRIIAQSAYAQYSGTAEEWTGPLASVDIDKTEMLKADLSNADELTHVGFEVGPDTIDIELESGWTWLGYLPNRNISVTTALASLTASEDDLIKGQVGYAQYVPDHGWIGSLNRMYPGEGYMINLAASGTLTYPNPNALPELMPTPFEEINTFDPDSLPITPWVVDDPFHYELTMTMTAFLESDEWNVNDPYDMVAVLSNGEVRGTARPVFISQLEMYRIFLTVYGSSSDENAFEFRIWDHSEETIYQGSEVFSFSADDRIGTITQPLVIQSRPLSVNDPDYVPQDYVLGQNYPNPFNPLTKIGIGVPEQSQVKVTVYDLMGREVKMLFFGQLEPGYRHVVWNGKDERGMDVSSGVYFVVMEGRGATRSFRDMKKMMLLK